MGTDEDQLVKLRQAIAVLEEQRPLLGDAVVEPALQGLRQQLAALQSQAGLSLHPTGSAQPNRPTHEERRLLTIFFADVAGSTSLAESMDPEEWHAVLDRLLSTLAGVILANHGMVAHYLGDGLLAFFGAQEVSERDPEWAVRAALASQEAVRALDLQPALNIRIGVHTGLVVIGDLGSTTWREYTAVGDAVNFASRLQSAAPPGGVLISHETFNNVRGIFDVSPQPLLQVKGKRDSARTYLVQSAKPRAFHIASRGVFGIETPTIGREPELAQLQEAYLDVYSQGRTAWAQIVGQPGMGKSRLLEEMMDFFELRPERLRLLRSRAFDGETRQPLALVRRLWFDRLGIAEDAPLAEAEDRWVEGFLELSGWEAGEEAFEAAHALGLLVGLPFAGSPYLGALREDPSQVKGRAMVVTRQLFRSLCRARPVVILLEDLHWADPSSWDYLLQGILESRPAGDLPGDHGLYILATARPEWAPPAALLSQPHYRQIDLQALSLQASRRLASKIMQNVDGISEEVLRLIVERAEGVPYFIEEIVNWLMDRGAIDTTSHPWRFVSERMAGSPFPASLQHLLYARLSSLERVDRRVLEHGSIFGRNFWSGGLVALGSPSSTTTLERLQPRGFVVAYPESSFEGEREWGFPHNLVREVTYESILIRERARLHKAAAAWLENQARQAGRLDEFAGLIGEHLERAGQKELAAGWIIRAGDRAKARGANYEARQFYDRALALLPPSNRELRWQALAGRSEVLSILGQYESRRLDLEALQALAEEFGDVRRLAEVYYRLGFSLANLGEDREALAAYESAVQAARQVGDRSFEALALALEVISLIRLGNREAAGAIAHKLLASLTELREDEKTVARVLTNLAVFYTEAGDLARAMDLLGQSVEINHRLGDRYGEAAGLGNLGYSYIQMGMPVKARAALERAAQLAESVGARPLHAYQRLNLALALWRSGELIAARQALEETHPQFRLLGDAFGYAAGQSYLALVLEASGQAQEAGQQFEAARASFSQVGFQAYAIDALSGLARCALAAGRTEQALQHARQVWDALLDHGPQGMEFPVWAYLTCARVAAAAGEVDFHRSAVQAGVQELLARAGKISDQAWQQSFLENIPEHQGILSLNAG